MTPDVPFDLSRLWAQFVYHEATPLLFNSGLFLWLFLAFFGVYLLVQRWRDVRVVYVVAFSLFFYYKTSGLFFVLLILSTLVDYTLGWRIHRARAPGWRRFWLILSLCANLGMLAFFKYTPFLIETVSALFGLGWDPGAIAVPLFDITAGEIFLPVGISFYTFQTMSYSIDVYRGKLEPERNVLDFAFFVTFFPQLVAGPIVRARDFLPQIRRELHVSRDDLGRGLLLVCGGLIKKAVISDYIAINFVDRVFADPLLYTGTENLIAVYGYALQIYCDFSGYSDMAIGIALLMGYRLPLNFNHPYRAATITDFWRRWHISLSSWLRDYLYIPLGGNRKGKTRQYVNLMLTMLLGGLWHGAAWQFVVWGGLHGAMLAIEKAVLDAVRLPSTWWTRALGRLWTFHFVCLAWVFFRARSFDGAFDVLAQIGRGLSWSILLQFVVGYTPVVLLLLAGYALHFVPARLDVAARRRFATAPLAVQALVVTAAIWAAVQVGAVGVQPFIYFQF